MLYYKSVLNFKNAFAFGLLYLAILCPLNASAQMMQSYDVVIYGGTSAGVSAAIQSSRMGKKVILIEPSNRMGGLTTGGLGKTDIGNKQAIGGISREFYQNIKKYYLKPENWIWEKREAYRGVGYNTFDEDAMWAFEPSAALKIYFDMLEKEPKPDPKGLINIEAIAKKFTITLVPPEDSCVNKKVTMLKSPSFNKSYNNLII